MKYAPKLYGKALAEAAAGPLDPKKEQDVVKNFARLMKERAGRAQWPKILAAAEKALREKEGRRKVTIESARPIADLRGAFKGLLQETDIIEEKVDSQLVAGVKLTLDDARQFDGSLRKKLDSLFSKSSQR